MVSFSFNSSHIPCLKIYLILRHEWSVPMELPMSIYYFYFQIPLTGLQACQCFSFILSNEMICQIQSLQNFNRLFCAIVTPLSVFYVNSRDRLYILDGNLLISRRLHFTLFFKIKIILLLHLYIYKLAPSSCLYISWKFCTLIFTRHWFTTKYRHIKFY